MRLSIVEVAQVWSEGLSKRITTRLDDDYDGEITQTQTHSDSCSARPRESHRFARMPSVVDREGGDMQILHA